MNNVKRPPQATRKDLEFMHKDVKWLDRSVVHYRIEERKDRFWVTMVFIDSNDPMRLITRLIDHYPTMEKAKVYAEIFQRQIRRDPRGTFRLDDDAHNLFFN